MPYYTENHTYYDLTHNQIYKNSNHLIPYIHPVIHHDSIFAFNYMHFQSTFTFTGFMINEKSCFIYPQH